MSSCKVWGGICRPRGAYAPRNSILVALEAQTMTVELEVLCRHAPNGPTPRQEAHELQPDVAGPCAIPILWQLAVLILANAQAANSIVMLHPLLEDGFHLCLHVAPRPTGMEASAARLRRELLRSRRHKEALPQLPHQADANAGRQAFVRHVSWSAGNKTPRAVSEDQGPRVAFFVDRPQLLVQLFF